MPTSTPSRLVLTLLLPLLCAGLAAAQAPQGAPTPGPTLAAGKAPAVPGGPRSLKWDELVPDGWDPMKGLAGLDMAGLSDADPRAAQMMKKMREVWDNAPTNPALEGQLVRIPGYVVPLEDTKDGVKEFLLAPYFGACIHTPPPPSNQIIHVLPLSPAKGVRSMDAVWVVGRLTSTRSESYMGASSYRIEASGVEPYQEKPR